MTRTTPEQRAELRRLVDAQETNAHYRSDYPEHAAMVALLNAGPALLADAEALAERERAGKYASPTPTPADVEAGRAVWTERGWHWKMTDAVIDFGEEHDYDVRD
jgi:hypothetical protein